MTKIIIIVATGQNRVIGKDGKIPWKLSADLRRFKELTIGHPIIMGRKTYESLRKALPGRINIVITRDKFFLAKGCVMAHSLEEALELASRFDKEKIFVIGGRQVYKNILPLADEVYLTLVKASFEGDVSFPELDPAEWSEISREQHQQDEKNLYDYEFLVYERIR